MAAGCHAVGVGTRPALDLQAELKSIVWATCSYHIPHAFEAVSHVALDLIDGLQAVVSEKINVGRHAYVIDSGHCGYFPSGVVVDDELS
jgi:hypothetical protein